MLTARQRDAVLKELDQLALKGPGKLSLTLELNCGMGGVVNTIRVKRYTRSEEHTSEL